MADVAALVVSARKGEFEAGFKEEGQTKEHAQLARSLGVTSIVIVVNKMDDPTVKWSQQRFTEILTKTTEYLLEIGFKEQQIKSVPISGLTGEGIERPTKAAWYSGDSLIDVLDCVDLPDRDEDGPQRLAVIDKDEEEGGNKLIIGKVESGAFRIGDKLRINPSRLPCQITQIINGNEDLVRYAKPGENVKIAV